jgi:hypothetical protein
VIKKIPVEAACSFTGPQARPLIPVLFNKNEVKTQKIYNSRVPGKLLFHFRWFSLHFVPD